MPCSLAALGPTFLTTFEVRMQDEPYVINLTISNGNPPPFVDVPVQDIIIAIATTTTVNHTYNVSNAFKHIYGGTLTYPAPTLSNSSPLPSWISYDDTSKVFNISKSSLNTAEVSIYAKTDTGKELSQEFTVTIMNTAPAVLAHFGTLSDQIYYDNKTFSWSHDITTVFSEVDPDQELTYVVDAPAWMTQSFAGDTLTLSGVFPADVATSYTVDVTANDSLETAASTLTIPVVINEPPHISTTIGDIDGKEGVTEWTILNNFADSEGDTISYSVTFMNDTDLDSSWITFDSTTKSLSYTPNAALPSPVRFKLIAEDPFNDPVEELFNMTVHYKPVENATFTSRTGEFRYRQYSEFILSKDIFIDTDIVSYSYVLKDSLNGVSWMTLENPTTTSDLLFSGSYQINENQLYTFELTATDAHGLTAIAEFYIQSLSVCHAN